MRQKVSCRSRPKSDCRLLGDALLEKDITVHGSRLGGGCCCNITHIHKSTATFSLPSSGWPAGNSPSWYTHTHTHTFFFFYRHRRYPLLTVSFCVYDVFPGFIMLIYFIFLLLSRCCVWFACDHEIDFGNDFVGEPTKQPQQQQQTQCTRNLECHIFQTSARTVCFRRMFCRGTVLVLPFY